MASPTLIDIRKIEWGKSFYWDLYFPSNLEWGIEDTTTVPPEPPEIFRKWFPANNVTEPVFSTVNKTIDAPFVNFNIPMSIKNADMSISFYETMYHIVREWLWSWCMYMYGIDYEAYITISRSATVNTSTGVQGVRPLSECFRPVILHKYNSDHSISVKRDYWVFPSGNLMLQLSSDSNPINETCTFSVISGMFKKSVTGSYQVY